jgi:hypothetical protein
MLASKLKGSPKSPKSKVTRTYGSTKKKLVDDYEVDERSDGDNDESDQAFSDKVFSPSDKALLRHIRSERHLAVLQGTKRAEMALKSPLPPMGYRVREDHENGHKRGRPATVWDVARPLPSKLRKAKDAAMKKIGAVMMTNSMKTMRTRMMRRRRTAQSVPRMVTHGKTVLTGRLRVMQTVPTRVQRFEIGKKSSRRMATMAFCQSSRSMPMIQTCGHTLERSDCLRCPSCSLDQNHSMSVNAGVCWPTGSGQGQKQRRCQRSHSSSTTS